MTAFGIPSADDQSSWVLDGWAWHIEQCADVPALNAAEARLYASLERARDKERPLTWIRDALALCAARRAEIAASMRQSANVPAVIGREEGKM